jgi:hypothetical protein
MKTRLIKDLGDMNPGELEPKAWNGGDVKFDNGVIDAMPEKECMKARIAVFEAIVDEVAEDAIDEKEAESDEPVTENDVEEVVEPIVDKAVALAIVPGSIRRRVANLIHRKVVTHKTRASLLAKAAHMVAEAVTETDYNAGADDIDTPIDETVDIQGEIKDATSEKDEAPNSGTVPTTSAWKRAWDRSGRRSRFAADDEYVAGADNIDNPIDETVDIAGEIKDATSEKDEAPNSGTCPTTSAWKRAWDRSGRYGRSRFEGDVGVDEGVDASDDSVATDSDMGAPVEGPASDIAVAVDDGLDTETKANMRYLVKSAIHHRRATARVSRRMTAQLTDNMMYQLRYALPSKFYSKYHR